MAVQPALNISYYYLGTFPDICHNMYSCQKMRCLAACRHRYHLAVHIAAYRLIASDCMKRLALLREWPCPHAMAVQPALVVKQTL